MSENRENMRVIAEQEQLKREAAPSPSPVVEVSEEMVEAACLSWFGGLGSWDRHAPGNQSEFRRKMRAALVAALRVR